MTGPNCHGEIAEEVKKEGNRRNEESFLNMQLWPQWTLHQRLTFLKCCKVASIMLTTYCSLILCLVCSSLNKSYLPPKSLLYLPSGGFHNQFSTLHKGLLLSRHLNRTLLIPPLSPSPHEHNLSYSLSSSLGIVNRLAPEEWQRYFDLSLLPVDAPPHTFLSTSSWHYRNRINCYAFGKYIHDLSPAASFLSSHYGITIRLIPFPDSENWTSLPWNIMMASFKTSRDPMICIANLFHLKLPSTLTNRDWSDFGTKLMFSPTILQYVNTYLEKLPVPFTAIHLRRGDKCKSRLGSPCRFSLEQINQTLTMENTPSSVFVATDETRAKEWRKISELNWQYINYSEPENSLGRNNPIKEVGWFAPVVIDSAVLTFAHKFIGTAASSMSKIIKWRRESWFADVQSHFLEDLIPIPNS